MHHDTFKGYFEQYYEENSQGTTNENFEDRIMKYEGKILFLLKPELRNATRRILTSSNIVSDFIDVIIKFKVTKVPFVKIDGVLLVEG